MAVNNRVYYATHKVGIAPMGSTSYTTVRGLQNTGMTTTFNLTQVFEIGQLAIYENIEGLPDIQMTMEKVLDGYAPLLTLATQLGTSATLSGRSTARCSVAMSIYPDTNNSATGTPGAEVQLSGLYLSSAGYTVPVDGQATENITLVGNDKVWVNLIAGTSFATYTDDPFVLNADVPRAISGSGGVQQRQDVLFTYATGSNGVDINGSVSGIGTVLPQDIPGISSSGTNNLSGNVYSAHVQSFSCSTDLGREDLFELGRRGPYFKFAKFPVEVTTEIAVIASSGDMVSATANGIISGTGCSVGNNLYSRTIRLHMCEGLQVNLGKQNKLASVNMNGGDTGGGNIAVTYTYTNFNDFHVYHPNDPNRAVAGFSPTSQF